MFHKKVATEKFSMHIIIERVFIERIFKLYDGENREQLFPVNNQHEKQANMLINLPTKVGCVQSIYCMPRHNCQSLLPRF